MVTGSKQRIPSNPYFGDSPFRTIKKWDVWEKPAGLLLYASLFSPLALAEAPGPAASERKVRSRHCHL
jgi:hypothetical protein